MANLIIRKSPLVLVKNIVFFQTLFTIFVAIFTLTISNSEKVIFDSNWQILVFIIVLGTFSLIYMFLRWYMEIFIISDNDILHKTGYFKREEEVIKKSSDYKYQISESVIGRFLKYRNLLINFGDNEILFRCLTDHSIRIVLDNLDPSRENLSINEINTFSIEELLNLGENGNIEFKSTLRYDLLTEKTNKDLEEAVLKNIVAFLNTSGGILLIGIGDDGKVLGIQNDLDSFKKKNADGFENHFNQLLKKYIGTEHLQSISISFEEYEKRTITRINVEAALEPAFIKIKGIENFFIKTGNSVTSLEVSEAIKYFSSNFNNGK